MTRLRWRLALWLAPFPIMFDPYPGDGVFVVQREGPTRVAYRLDSLDVTVDNSFDPRRFGDPNDHSVWGGSRRLTFSGKGSR